jgi:hypothetical protein
MNNFYGFFYNVYSRKRIIPRKVIFQFLAANFDGSFLKWRRNDECLQLIPPCKPDQARLQMVTRDALVILHLLDNRHFFHISGVNVGCGISKVERVTDCEMLNNHFV